MTSVQAALSSTRPLDEPQRSSFVPDSARSGTLVLAQQDPETALILQRLGGHFAADIADLVSQSRRAANLQLPQEKIAQPKAVHDQFYAVREFVLARVRGGQVQEALDFVQRHKPDQHTWLRTQVARYVPHALGLIEQSANQAAQKIIAAAVTVIPDAMLIDVEAARLAKVLGQFVLYRAWAYSLAVDDGDGHIDRSELEELWQHTGIAGSARHVRRILREGSAHGYWTQDLQTQRIYLTGQVKLAQWLVQQAAQNGYLEIAESDKPGRRRVPVDLAGTLQQAAAKLYAAWMHSRDRRGSGVLISRQRLCTLWDVSLPTLLTWEKATSIGKQANYAQQNNTHFDSVPSYAYLTLNRDGSQATAWRLPNTYSVKTNKTQQRSRTGKARKTRKAVKLAIASAKQRGALGAAALPRLGRLYFKKDAAGQQDPFRTCSRYLRKLGQQDGDVFRWRYFYVGKRHGVTLYEPYDVVTNVPHTSIAQRLIWQEQQPLFAIKRATYLRQLKDDTDYYNLLNR